MIGLFGALDMAARSLSVQQQGTEVSGQNLANVNNPAYAREQLVEQPSTPLPTIIGQEGTGAQAVSITEVRDSLLDSQIQAESSVTGSLNAQQSALQEAQGYLGEQIGSNGSSDSATSTDTSANGLTADLSTLFNSFQSLSTDPSNLSQRQAVVASAQQLATQFNSVSSQLNALRGTLNSSIQSDVNSSNQDLSDIASLNQQIIAAEAGGGTANDLVDLREQKIEDLAGKVNLATTANSNGSVDISIGGVTMVSGGSTTDSLETYDAGGGQLLIKAQTAGTTLSLTGGSIQGNIDVRDGALASLQSDTNTLASQLITEVNSVYSAGYDLNGKTGQKLFTGSDAATIGVNSALASDPSQFQASGVSGASGDNTVALSLAQLANQNIAGLNNYTFSQSYAQTVANLGVAAASVNDQVTNGAAVTQMLTSQRDSESGVSVDDEMTNLMQFQKAYEASAELITTLNEMLTTVIGMKTV